MDRQELRSRIYHTLHELSTEEGINASGKEDVYSCIFGRDSAKSILKIIKSTQNMRKNTLFNEEDHGLETDSLLSICRRGLLTLASLQGRETNIESGEEPGKIIHEYRPSNYERLLTIDEKPWYVYPDGKLRNYDSIDSTPLFLIAVYKYWEATGDNEFLLSVLPNVEAGLNWMITYGDRDKDYLLEYELPKERKYGGLVVQSWTDSKESLIDAAGNFPLYPIAPVEVQGYGWLAYKLWSGFYSDESLNVSHTQSYAHKLDTQAKKMKEQFNEMFLMQDEGYYYAAQVLDGAKNQIQTVTGNPLLLLWATHMENGKRESILKDEYVPDFVTRAFLPDLYDPRGGIRTMSMKSPTFMHSSDNYHNGFFWPILNGMSHEGLVNWDFTHHAGVLGEATLKPIEHYQRPVELYNTDELEQYVLYKSATGQTSCMDQAWSAAAALDLLTQ